MKRRYTKEEDDKILELRGSGFTAGEIATKLKRSVTSIRSRYYLIKPYKPKGFPFPSGKLTYLYGENYPGLNVNVLIQEELSLQRKLTAIRAVISLYQDETKGPEDTTEGT